MTQAILWREGFRGFVRHREEWIKCAAWFFIFMLPSFYAILWQTGTYSVGNPAVLDAMLDMFRHHDPDYIKAHKDVFANIIKNMPKQPWPVKLAGWIAQPIVWIQLYVFYGFFMKRENVVGQLRQDWKGFFYIWSSFYSGSCSPCC